MNNQPSEVSPNKTLALVIFSILLICYVVFVVLLRINLPPTEKLIDIVTSIYRNIGYPLVFLSALGEATFPIGLYFPGSTIVMLGFALSKTGEIAWHSVYVCSILGCMSGYCLNYMLGKYGWLRFLKILGLEKGIHEAKKKLEKNERRAFAFGFMSATTGAFLSCAAGTLKIPFRRFFLQIFLSTCFWAGVWGSVAYLFGYAFVEIFLKYIIFIIWGGLIIYLVKVYFFKK